MKSLLKLTLMSVFILGLYSCGEQNESSGSKSSSNSSVNEFGQITGSGVNYNTPEELIRTLQQRSMADGARIGEPVYHIGPAFGGTAQQVSFDLGDLFDFSFNTCFVFNGNASGDCNQNGTGINDTQLTNNLLRLVAEGEYKVIRDANHNGVGYDLADGVQNGGFSFAYRSFDRSDDIYRAMTNEDGRVLRARVLSDAQITLDNGQQIRGEYLENYYQDGTVEGYVISTSFPTVANPLLITEGSNNGGGIITGALDFMGANKVRSVSATYHSFSYDAQTNTWRATPRGQLRY